MTSKINSIFCEDTVKRITNATLYLEDIDKENNCVPDWAIKKASEDFKLSDRQCRLIRDEIQMKSRFNKKENTVCT